MKRPLILTFDCGTQSTRALLVDKSGGILAKVQKYFEPYYSTRPGYAEQKIETYWQAFSAASQELHAKYPELVKDIIAVTITTIRDTYTIVDQNCEPLRDLIVWLDQREAKCLEPLPAKARLSFALVGMAEAIQDQRKISKSNWIRENEKELWDKAYKYASYSTILIHRLTGKIIDSNAAQIGHIPFDYKNKVWDKPNNIMCPVFNVDQRLLVDLVDPGTIIGQITKEASRQTGIKVGLPLIATASDKGCETLGVGVLANDMAALSFGTAATVQCSTESYVTPDTLLPAYPGAVKTVYNPEVQVFRGYWMISWFKKEFAAKEVMAAQEMGISPEDLLNRELKTIPAGSDGLMLQPYWSPLLKIPEAKGSIIGFDSDHTRAHIYKAIIEGIGYGLLEGLRRIEDRGNFKVNSIAVGGGGSQSDEICQITADMFGVPVKRIQTYEACGVGASMIGFVAMQEFANYQEALQAMVHYQKPFEPDLETHQIYDELYCKVYKEIYKHLKPVYKTLRAITNKRKGGVSNV